MTKEQTETFLQFVNGAEIDPRARAAFVRRGLAKPDGTPTKVGNLIVNHDRSPDLAPAGLRELSEKKLESLESKGILEDGALTYLGKAIRYAQEIEG